jgi:required for meiotic nuclear division protein 1
MVSADLTDFRPAFSDKRPQPAGTPEVLSYELAGEVAPGEVKALLVGHRINMRGLRDFVEPDQLDFDGNGIALVFRHGAVVLFGVTPAAEALFLDQIREQVVDPLVIPELETAGIEVSPEREEQVDGHGHIVLKALTPERLLLAGTALARSVALAHDELRIAETFDRIEPLVAALQVHGRVGHPIRSVMRQVGEVLAAQHRMVGRTMISEKPEILWDHPELDRLYGRLEAEFELGDRARIIDHKLQVIGDAADALLNVIQDRRSVRLELAIIALIAFEIVINLAEKLV